MICRGKAGRGSVKSGEVKQESKKHGLPESAKRFTESRARAPPLISVTVILASAALPAAVAALLALSPAGSGRTRVRPASMHVQRARAPLLWLAALICWAAVAAAAGNIIAIGDTPILVAESKAESSAKTTTCPAGCVLTQCSPFETSCLALGFFFS